MSTFVNLAIPNCAVNKLWKTTDNIPGTVAKINEVFDEAAKVVQFWIEALGDDNAMERKGDAPEQPGTDEYGDMYLLYTVHPVPTVDEAATQIWNATFEAEASIAKAEADKAAEEAEAAFREARIPGRAWVHETVRVPLPDILKREEFADSPQLSAAVRTGYVSAPFDVPFNTELSTAHWYLHGEHPALTRELNLTGRLLEVIQTRFQEGKYLSMFWELTVDSTMWLQSPAEVQAAIEETQTAYDTVLAELNSASDVEVLEEKSEEDEDELDGLAKWVHTLWNGVVEAEETVRMLAGLKEEVEEYEHEMNFEVYLPAAVREHASIAPLDLKETFEAPLADDAWLKRHLGPLVAEIAADIAETRATRLAAIYVRELLRIFSDDCEYRKVMGPDGRADVQVERVRRRHRARVPDYPQRGV